MPNLLLGNPLQSFNEGMQTGRANRFNALAGQAVAAPPDQRGDLVAQAAQADPMKAVALNGALSQQDNMDEDRRNKTLVNMSRTLLTAPEQYRDQIYQQMKPSLVKVGLSQVPDVYTPEVGQVAQSIVDAWTPVTSMPSGFREFQLQAKAAGLKEGTPEYAQAARVALGTEGRASNAGFGFETAEGADGRKYLQRRNPRTGAVEVYDPSTGDFAPVGGASAATGSTGVPQLVGPVQYQGAGGAPTATPADEANALLAQGVPADQAAMRVAAKRQQQLGGAYPTLVFKDGKFSDGTSGGVPDRAPADPSLLVSRAPEATAAATEDAKQGVQLAYLPRTEAVKTQADIERAAGTERAKAEVEADTKRTADARQRQKDAQDTLNLLDQAEKILPNATGSAGGQFIDTAAASVGRSTEGAQATARLQTIAGQLTSKMPRMQGPQSDRDVQLYQQMAGDLANPRLPVETRKAAAQTIRELNQKYANGPAQAAPSAQPAPASNFGHLWN